MGLSPACALLFLRGDVRPATKTVELVQTSAPFEKALKEGNNWAYLRLVAGIDPYLKLSPYYAYCSRAVSSFEIDSHSQSTVVLTNRMSPDEQFSVLVAKGIHSTDVRETRCFESDTGELVTDLKKGLFTVDTPGTQGCVGFLNACGEVNLGNVTVEKCSSFASVVFSSLDGKSLAASDHVLLTVVGDADNTSEQWGVAGWYADGRPAKYVGRLPWGRTVGRGPVLVVPVSVQIRLTRDATAARLRVYALDAMGERTGTVPLERAGPGLRFLADGGQYQTIYYELAAE